MLAHLTVKAVKDRVGDLIRQLRNRDNMTQEELADRVGMSRITIQNLEAGKNPTMDTVLKVLQYFDLLQGFDNYIESEIQNNSHESLY